VIISNDLECPNDILQPILGLGMGEVRDFKFGTEIDLLQSSTDDEKAVVIYVTFLYTVSEKNTFDFWS